MNQKMRVVVCSDFPPLDAAPGDSKGPARKKSDPDDLQTMIRFLSYANEFRIEGLVASSATMANIARKQNMLDMLDAYDQVDENLRLHDLAFPTAAALKAITWEGLSGAYGQPAAGIIGEGRDTEASEHIIAVVDRNDPDPVWFLFWGGSCELAQALWKVKSTRPPSALASFVAKIKIYLIARQDGTALWIRENFPAIFLVESLDNFFGMNFNTKGARQDWGDMSWVRAHVKLKHGPLGALYPPSGIKGVKEGDTPSFFYLLSAHFGLSNPEDPSLGGWGGRFVPDATGLRHYSDAPEGQRAVMRWQEAYQNDFMARMEWHTKSPAHVNHQPRAVLNGDKSRAILHLNVSAGTSIQCSAADSMDPDGQALNCAWWVYREAGTYEGTVLLDTPKSMTTAFKVPDDARGKSIHIMLEVKDAGFPVLTAYRRLVVQVDQ